MASRVSSAPNATARAACAALAGSLMERAYRIGHRDSDGHQALDMLRVAAQSPNPSAACEASIRSARLAGELARDPAVTYAELSRAKSPGFLGAPTRAAGMSGAQCVAKLDADLDLIAAFQASSAESATPVAPATSQARSSSPPSPAATSPRPPQIERVETWPGSDTARVVLFLDRAASYRVDDESGLSPSTALDFDGLDLSVTTPREVSPGPGILRTVRLEPTSTGTRVFVELDGAGWRRVFHLTDPYRVVIDVARHRPGSRVAGTPVVSRVVLDPGHGGKDVGAVGPRGLREKDVTLDVARRAATALVEQGIQVILTRDDDRLPTLEERTARANSAGADLFVSIHCNASEWKGHRGVETYVLDATRDELAARIAARENATPLGRGDELAAILGRIRLADQARQSSHFAYLLQRASMGALQTRYQDVTDGGVHTAGFFVLFGASMPSVLFEASYLSNPVEEARLDTSEYRQLLADAIVNAIRAYRLGK
ncbi:MAG: N-acetylmuramoyl-L-alanine amidase [Polyangiaceae bacterium]